MDIYVLKNSFYFFDFDFTFSLFSVFFHHDFVIYIDFTNVATNTATDNVTNYVTHRPTILIQTYNILMLIL